VPRCLGSIFPTARLTDKHGLIKRPGCFTRLHPKIRGRFDCFCFSNRVIIGLVQNSGPSCKFRGDRFRVVRVRSGISSTRILRTAADQDPRNSNNICDSFIHHHLWLSFSSVANAHDSSSSVRPPSPDDNLCNLASREPVGFWVIGSAFWISLDSL
jgi:hypothetical protein